jgi:ABC-type transporter Mla maintaining outer membrane lipid asymmetry ATPase subunit MlaF
MTAAAPAMIRLKGVTKEYGGPMPLRVSDFGIGEGDGVVLSGLDAQAAEAFSFLVTGASLPDEGNVHVFGTDTRDIATDTAWLQSLDRLGLVTERALLLDQLTVAQNLALPLSLSIDPMPADVRARVDALAGAVGLTAEQLAQPVSSLSPLGRMHLHLGRALAMGPELLLLEHPTASLDPEDARQLGETLGRIAGTRRLAWVAISADVEFARAAGGRQLTLVPATGALVPVGGFWRRLLARTFTTSGDQV